MTEQNEIQRLKEIIKRRDREILDIKYSVANVLDTIRTINESNQYSHPEIVRRKISELCTNTRYELLVDEKNRTNTADQSNN